MAFRSLEASLTYQPQVLEFGTSGRRGKVIDLTQLEVYINALAELEYLQSLIPSEGGIMRGKEFYFGRDLRPSSTSFVPEEDGRGEIAQAIVAAIRDAGMIPVNVGEVPTPAVMCYAVARAKGIHAAIDDERLERQRFGRRYGKRFGRRVTRIGVAARRPTDL